MKFKKYLRNGEPYWFSGIYKIVQYTNFNGEKCKPYYHAYYINYVCSKNWGDYVGGRINQFNKKLTFRQCVNLCTGHKKYYVPSKTELENAEKVRKNWLKEG